MREKRAASIGIDSWTPNGARICDYLLGGRENRPTDRAAANRMLQSNPAARKTAQANRAFLGRVVSHLASEVGIGQFPDIGSGLPTRRSVNEVAQEINPDARIAYVDQDAAAIRHSQAILARDGVRNVIAFQGDLRKPGRILDSPRIAGFLDLRQPVAVLMLAVLHFISDEEDAHGVVHHLGGGLAPGSHIAISHTVDESPPEVDAAVRHGFQFVGAALTPRPRAEIDRFFEGFELLEPGVVDVCDWRPDPLIDDSTLGGRIIVGGVGACP